MGIWTFPVLKTVAVIVIVRQVNSFASMAGPTPPETTDNAVPDDAGVPIPDKPPRYLPDAPVAYETHGTYLGPKTNTLYWIVYYPDWDSYAIYIAETTSTRRQDYIALSKWYSTLEAAKADINRIF